MLIEKINMSTRLSPAPKYNVCLMHSFDPRSRKVGGVETFVRDYIKHLPDDVSLLIIGNDIVGDLKIGEVQKIALGDRSVDFLPVMYWDEAAKDTYGQKVHESLTFQYVYSLFKYYFRIRKLIRSNHYSLDLRRIEFAFFPIVLGAPYVQMLHDGASKGSSSSSLLNEKFFWVKTLCERITVRFCSFFFCVNSDLTARLKRENPKFADKLDTLTTWADPEIYHPTPYAFADKVIRVVYGGRMDVFKRPDIMFQVIARLRDKSPHPVEFHYLGDGDVHAFAEFAAIQDVTILHGRKSSREMSEIFTRMHVGILTSDYEGMPRIVMEMLASGRPVVALHLPQLEDVIFDGTSGALIPRSASQIDDMAGQILACYGAIESGAITPEIVARQVAAYTPEALLSKLFRAHRSIQDKMLQNALAAPSTGSPF